MSALARLVVALLLVPAVAGAAAAQQSPSGTLLYGIQHEEHGEIGTHGISFSRSGGDLMVEVRNRMTVKLVFITLFRYEAERREIWRDGRMLSYRGKTHDDGTDLTLAADIQGDKLIIDGPDGRTEAPAGTFPSHPWNPKIVEQTLLMDTETGKLLEVAVREAGEETIEARGGPVKATKFVVTGDHEREIWFGPDGTWLQMRFDSDGSDVTFTLK